MNCKVFSQRFNQELSALDFPDDLSEKIKAVAKVFDVSRHMANAMIFGQILPTEEQLNHMAHVLEVCPHWLGGIGLRR